MSRHASCALVAGVRTCSLPSSSARSDLTAARNLGRIGVTRPICSNVRLPFVVRQVAESSHCTAEGLPGRCSTPSNPFATLEHLFCIGFQGQADSSTAQSTLVVGSALEIGRAHV